MTTDEKCKQFLTKFSNEYIEFSKDESITGRHDIAIANTIWSFIMCEVLKGDNIVILFALSELTGSIAEYQASKESEIQNELSTSRYN